MRQRLLSQEAFAIAALAFSLLFIFVDQAHDTGLSKGHRGWCSANVLAIIEHAKLENGFVGHTLMWQDPDGTRSYTYFDRYPVFFSAAMHVVLNTVELSRGEQIFVARQAMNALYCASVIFAVLFLLELGVSVPIAVGAATLAASGRLLVFYRDMIHFDHAALTGFVALIWAIARWYRLRNNTFILGMTAFAVCMGRGYASFAVLAVWWIVEAVLAWRAGRAAPLATFKGIVLGAPTRACALAIGIAVACLSYNIWREAEKNDIGWTEVGIVDSARRRLTSTNDDELSAGNKKELQWARFANEQARRFVINAQPFSASPIQPKKHSERSVLLALAIFAVIGVYVARRKPELRPPLIVAALAGVVWITAMRRLTAFHDFTMMFTYSANTVLMLALVGWIPRRAALLATVLGCSVLVNSTYKRNTSLERAEEEGEAYTKDFARIEKLLEPGEVYVTDPLDRRKIVPGVPAAVGWFLPHNPMARDEKSNTTISTKKNKKGLGVNLTPMNTKLFLYRK
jgi:hypothetical protein